MGAVSFSLDPELVAHLKSELAISIFVETGTFKGDSVARVESSFDELISIDLSEELYREAQKRFENHSKIQILHGHSPQMLLELRSRLADIGVLYWLDAHWCVANLTAGEQSQCPLLEELKAIDQLNNESVILIDDARLFLAPPLAPHEISQWPTFHQIVSQLLSMSDSHEIMIVNDVIAFFPKILSGKMVLYAQTKGLDLLAVINQMKEVTELNRQLEKKESVIQIQEKVIQEKDKVIQEKERVLNQLAQAVKAYQLAFYPLLPLVFLFKAFFKTKKRIVQVFLPRIGNLNQYSPRVLVNKALFNPIKLKYAPKISIITPSFQQGEYIERTILSVLRQNYQNLEYIIQDGGSTDSTVEILRKYENKFSSWVSEKDNGQSDAINKGFAKSSGEIMGWINSDDLILQGTLNVVADYFCRHPEIDVVYGNRLLIDKEDREIGRWIMPRHDNFVLSWVDYVPQESLFWRRSVWDRVGGRVDESFKFAMDWDLLLRFRDCGARFAHIPMFLGAFRIHEQQKTSAVISQVGQQEMNFIRQRIHGRIPDQTEIREAVLPFLLKHILVDIMYRIKMRINFN